MFKLFLLDSFKKLSYIIYEKNAYDSFKHINTIILFIKKFIIISIIITIIITSFIIINIIFFKN